MPGAARATSRISAPTGGRSTCRAGACSGSTHSFWAATLPWPTCRTRRSPRRRRAWVDRRLALFLHKPLFDRDRGETEITGRFVNPGPRQALLAALAGAVPALVACGHVHQYRNTEVAGTRHVWGTSTAFVLPDRLQPRYGTKEVGYVEHRLEPDGRHDSRLVQVAGVPTLNIADFPGAYGPL